MKRIVLTGGTYAGKTSLIELFKKDGYEVISDIGLEIIKELNTELGLDKQKEFRNGNPIEFYSRIIKKQLEIENSFRDKIVVCDRGVYDYLAMLELIGTDIPHALIKLVEKTSYDIVFVCDVLSDFDGRKNSGRILTKSDSLRLKKLIEKTYENAGHAVIPVKEMPLSQRYKFIKNYI